MIKELESNIAFIDWDIACLKGENIRMIAT